MSAESSPSHFVFPRWANYLLPALVVLVGGGALYAPALVTVGFSPTTTDVGYAPVQPVPYSHKIHAGDQGIDCRVCHTTVEKAAFAAIPPTQVCMNCHTQLRADSPRLEAVRQSWATGKPIEWTKIHDLPDYAYFNHSAHINKGVGCVSCHGRVDQMEVVQQVQPLSMSWCLDCHRAPENHLRPKDQVFNLAWKAPAQGDETQEQAQLRVGLELKKQYGIRGVEYMQSCSTCHR